MAALLFRRLLLQSCKTPLSLTTLSLHNPVGAPATTAPILSRLSLHHLAGSPSTTPTSTSLLHKIQPLPTIPSRKPTLPILFPRRFNAAADPPPELRHQEITGPTVDRDVSPLANQTRETLEAMRTSISKLSSALAMVGCGHLGLGAWVVYSHPGDEVVMLQGLMAFGLPFSAAFLMRRTLKPMAFLSKMEDQGRLQVLTLALQVGKNLDLLFGRLRVVSIGCAVGVVGGSLVAILWR